MMAINRARTFTVLASAIGGLFLIETLTARSRRPGPRPCRAKRPPSLSPLTSGFDYIKRDVMIPMRDGVKLHTVILVPKGAKSAPILLTRTPYDATEAHEPRPKRPLRPHPRAATTTPPTSSSKAATFAWSRTCAASTAPKATM